MKKIIFSLSVIAIVGALAVGITTAYFSDTETSSGNTFAAGAIDLGIDNDSWYNGQPNANTSWSLTFDLDDGSGPSGGGLYQYFDFSDLKPGDWGEDTISLHVNDNDAWVCATVTLDTDEENTVTEPESDLQDSGPQGELAGEVYFYWWADDGDNVYETHENLLPAGPLGVLGVGGTAIIPIADSNGSIFDPEDLADSGAMFGAQTYYVGKFWCFGDATPNPVADNQGDSPAVDSGFNCDGASVTNISQSDSMTATISFSAIQERNNEDFACND